jgi:hypothetical protein
MLCLDKGLVRAALAVMGQGSSLVRERRGRWRIILQSGATHLLAPLHTVVIGGHGTNTFSIVPGVQKSKVIGSDSAADSAGGLPSGSMPKSYRSWAAGGREGCKYHASSNCA